MTFSVCKTVQFPIEMTAPNISLGIYPHSQDLNMSIMTCELWFRQKLEEEMEAVHEYQLVGMSLSLPH